MIKTNKHRLSYTPSEIYTRRVISAILMVALFLFWSLPVTAVQALTNLGKKKKTNMNEWENKHE